MARAITIHTRYVTWRLHRTRLYQVYRSSRQLYCRSIHRQACYRQDAGVETWQPVLVAVDETESATLKSERQRATATSDELLVHWSWLIQRLVAAVEMVVTVRVPIQQSTLPD